MTLTSEAKLQDATVISKTTQTIIDQVIGCASYDYITLYFTYVKGDETGLLVKVWSMKSADATAFQDGSWTAAAGRKTFTLDEYYVDANTSAQIVVDIRGYNYIKFTQGGSDDDGTPTGTLAASYSMTQS